MRKITVFFMVAAMVLMTMTPSIFAETDLTPQQPRLGTSDQDKIFILSDANGEILRTDNFVEVRNRIYYGETPYPGAPVDENEKAYTIEITRNFDTKEAAGKDTTVNPEGIEKSGYCMFFIFPNKTVTLKSRDNPQTPEVEQYSITQRANDRGTSHIVLSDGGTLILENIIFDGNNTGGGIDVHAGISQPAKIILNNNAIIQNINQQLFSFAGIILRDGAQATLNSGSQIRNNSNIKSDSGQGGGISVQEGSKLTVNPGAKIYGNTSTTGGGIFSRNSDVIINGGDISNNSADWGGGLFVYTNSSAGGPSTIDIKKADINHNIAKYYGGGIVINGEQTLTTIQESSISNNSGAYGGGGIYTYENTGFTASRTTFENNQSQYNGGGIHTKSKKAVLQNVTFTTNAANFAGAIFIAEGNTTIQDSNFVGNEARMSGGAVYLQRAGQFTVNENVNFSKNKADIGSGGGIFAQDYDYTYPTADLGKYQHLILHPTTQFRNNTAKNGIYSYPPENADSFNNLKFGSTSFSNTGILPYNHVLNNFDVNYDPLRVVYSFVPEDATMTLPQDVIKLLPEMKGAEEGTVIESPVPQSTVITVDDGVWEFKGWDTESVTLEKQSVLVTGKWAFTATEKDPPAGGGDETHEPGDVKPPSDTHAAFKPGTVEKIQPETKPKTGDDSTTIYALIGLISTFSLILWILYRKLRWGNN